MVLAPLFSRVPIAEQLLGEIPEELRSRVQSILENAGGAVSQLVGPLTTITNREDMEALLRYLLPHYQSTLEASVEALLELGITTEQLLSIWTGARAALDTSIRDKADLLGPEGLEQVEGAIASTAALSQWTMDIQRRTDLDALANARAEHITARVTEPLILAQMALAGVIVILEESVVNWREESVPVLCELADDYMTAVEDIFYAQTTGAVPDDEDLTPFDEVRRQLGI